jgi:hypothetical protein
LLPRKQSTATTAEAAAVFEGFCNARRNVSQKLVESLIFKIRLQLVYRDAFALKKTPEGLGGSRRVTQGLLHDSKVDVGFDQVQTTTVLQDMRG